MFMRYIEGSLADLPLLSASIYLLETKFFSPALVGVCSLASILPISIVPSSTALLLLDYDTLAASSYASSIIH